MDRSRHDHAAAPGLQLQAAAPSRVLARSMRPRGGQEAAAGARRRRGGRIQGEQCLGGSADRLCLAGRRARRHALKPATARLPSSACFPTRALPPAAQDLVLRKQPLTKAALTAAIDNIRGAVRGSALKQHVFEGPKAHAHTHARAHTHAHTHTHTCTHTHTSKHTSKQANKQTSKQANKQTQTQIHKGPMCHTTTPTLPR
jgi:hypothetical protein